MTVARVLASSRTSILAGISSSQKRHDHVKFSRSPAPSENRRSQDNTAHVLKWFETCTADTKVTVCKQVSGHDLRKAGEINEAFIRKRTVMSTVDFIILIRTAGLFLNPKP